MSPEPALNSPSVSASSSGRRGGIGAGFLLIFVVYFWVVSHGTWRLFEREEFGQFFDYQALSFTHGRLDVPPEAVGIEAFVYHGKSYGYWGPFPAFLRLPLAVFGRGPWVGHTARASCLLAAMLTVAAFGGVAHEIALIAGRPFRRRLTLVALLGLVFGSTLLFLLSWSYVFHEVLLWAGALVQISAWLGLRHLRTGSLPALLGAIATAAGAGLTRPTLGYGAILGAALVTGVTALAAWRAAALSGSGSAGSSSCSAWPRPWAWPESCRSPTTMSASTRSARPSNPTR